MAHLFATKSTSKLSSSCFYSTFICTCSTRIYFFAMFFLIETVYEFLLVKDVCCKTEMRGFKGIGGCLFLWFRLPDTEGVLGRVVSFL